MKKKGAMLLAGILTSMLGILTAYAITAQPNERELQFIQYGELEGQQIQLHEASEVLRAQILANSERWEALEIEQGQLWADLFQ